MPRTRKQDILATTNGNGSNGTGGLSDALTMFYEWVRTCPPKLTRGKEVALAIAKDRGDQKAHMALFESCTRLVIKIAIKYQKLGEKHGCELVDVLSFGVMGLDRAVDGYNWRIGRLTTYATCWIKQAILREIEKCNLAHVTPEIHRKLTAVSKECERLDMDFNVDSITTLLGPSDKKTHNRTMSSSQAVRQGYTVQNIVSLDSPFTEGRNTYDEGDTLQEILADPGAKDPLTELIKKTQSEWIAERLLSLSAREQDIIALRYGLIEELGEYTLDEVAARFDLSRERIRQIEVRAINTLRGSWSLQQREHPQDWQGDELAELESELAG